MCQFLIFLSLCATLSVSELQRQAEVLLPVVMSKVTVCGCQLDRVAEGQMWMSH